MDSRNFVLIWIELVMETQKSTGLDILRAGAVMLELTVTQR